MGGGRKGRDHFFRNAFDPARALESRRGRAGARCGEGCSRPAQAPGRAASRACSSLPDAEQGAGSPAWGGGLLGPRFRNPASLWSPVCRENTRSAGRAARIGSPESDCAPHRRDKPGGPLRGGLWVAPGLGPVVAPGLGPELASTAAMWSLTFVECLLPAPPFTTFSPWGEPQKPPCTPGGSEPRPSHAAGDGCRIPGPAGCRTVLRPPVPFSGCQTVQSPQRGLKRQTKILF